MRAGWPRFVSRAGLGLALAAASACGGGADLGDCPPDSLALQVAGRQYLERSCALAGCHGGGARQGGVGLDTLEAVRARADDAYDQVESGSMPPQGRAAASDVEALRVFLACGAPDVR